jgi:hypothetical protein
MALIGVPTPVAVVLATRGSSAFVRMQWIRHRLFVHNRRSAL